MKRGTLDSTPEAVCFANTFEQANIGAVARDDIFTKDIVVLYKDGCQYQHVTTSKFMEAAQKKVLAQTRQRLEYRNVSSSLRL